MPVRSVTLRLLGDKKNVEAALDWTQTRAHQVTDKPYTLKINTDVEDPAVKLAALNAQLEALRALAKDLQVGVNVLPDKSVTKTLADLAKVNTELDRIGRRLDSPRVSLIGLDKSNAELLAIAATLEKVKAAEQDAATAGLAMTSRFTGLPLGLGALVSIWGGLAHVSGLHIAVDAAIELLALLGPATLALVAFGGALAALGPTASMIYQREKNMYIATDVLGQNMYGLSGNLNALNKQFRPQVISVWGDALTIVNQHTGLFSQLVGQAANWVQRFAARITVDLKNGTGLLGSLIQAGARDLTGFGQVLSGIGSVLLKVFQVAAQTHIAEDLLAVVGVAAKLLSYIRDIPTPLLAIVAGLHGIYLWGGLAFNGVAKLAGVLGALFGIPELGALERLGGAFDSFAAKTLTAARGMPVVVSGMKSVAMAADGTAIETGRAGTLMAILRGKLDLMAAAGLGARSGLEHTVTGLKGVATDAEGAVVKTGLFRGALAALTQVPVWGWVAAGAALVIGLGFAFMNTRDATKEWIDSLNAAITKASGFSVFNMMSSDLGQVNQKIKQVNSSTQSFANMYTGVASRFGSSSVMAADAVIGKDQELQAETSKLMGQMTNFGQGVQWIMKTYRVDYPTAIGIAMHANVDLTKNITGTSRAAEIARQQIVGLMTGLGQIGGPAGVAGKDFEALAFASNDITSKVSQLNSAWDQWLKSVTGSQSGFDTFAQGLDTLNQDSGTFTWHLGQLSIRGTQTKAAIDSLTASGLNLNQAFAQEVGNLGSYIDALRTAGASTDIVDKALKAGIAALIPFARGSKEATSQLYALAQQGDYTGKNSIKGLAEWAGVKGANALKVMKGAADQATIAASNLANTISRLLNTQFENDIIQASGASGALAKYTNDLVYNQQNTRAGQGDRAALIADLEKAGLSAKQAAAYVDGLSTSLGKVPKNTYANIFINTYGNAQAPGPSISPKIRTVANGGLITGGIPGRDSVFASLMPGEVVVPTSMVNAGAVDHLRGRLPGFAFGGIVAPLRASGMHGGAAAGQSITIIVNVPPTTNPDDVARSIQQMLRDYKRHMGGKSLGIA